MAEEGSGRTLQQSTCSTQCGRAEGGTRVAEVCQRTGVTEQTFYKWKRRVAGANAGRTQQVTTTNNGAYTRYVYGGNYVQRIRKALCRVQEEALFGEGTTRKDKD